MTAPYRKPKHAAARLEEGAKPTQADYIRAMGPKAEMIKRVKQNLADIQKLMEQDEPQ